jgi:hypothetical protein
MTTARETKSESATPDLSEEFAEIARQLLARKRDAFIVELFESLRDEIGDLASDARLSALLEASVTENIVSVINYLESGTPINDLDASSAALTHARTLAQRDIPLSVLFRAYRVGYAKFLQVGLDVVAESDPVHQVRLTHMLINRSSDFIDKVSEQVGRAYEAERDQWVGDRGGIRQHWVAEVLSGRAVDLAEAEAVLGYRFNGTHVGVQMWVPPNVPGIAARTAFEEVRRHMVAQFSPIAPLILVPRDERELHAWFPVRTGFAIPIDKLVTALRTSGRPVQVAIGRPQSGVAGFRLTMGQADRVKDIALASTNQLAPALTYDQLGAIGLMAADIDALRRFVLRTLGRLAKHGEREQTLRETLREFLGHNRSYSATAQAMVLHRNSVQYRVQRALELCEQDLNDAEVVLDLHTALTAAHWLGRAVLERG